MRGLNTAPRSVVYYCHPQQEVVIRQVMAEMANVWDAPLVTEVAPLQNWQRAEDYHQNYFRQHAEQGYCAVVVAPKVAKFRQLFAARCKV